MARTITITFNDIDLNTLVQVGDILYYKDISENTNVRMGAITAVDFTNKTITCSIGEETPNPTNSDYIFFVEDNKANQSDILGYYAEAVMKNDSNEYAELFQVTAGLTPSSK